MIIYSSCFGADNFCHAATPPQLPFNKRFNTPDVTWKAQWPLKQKKWTSFEVLMEISDVNRSWRNLFVYPCWWFPLICRLLVRGEQSMLLLLLLLMRSDVSCFESLLQEQDGHTGLEEREDRERERIRSQGSRSLTAATPHSDVSPKSTPLRDLRFQKEPPPPRAILKPFKGHNLRHFQIMPDGFLKPDFFTPKWGKWIYPSKTRGPIAFGRNKKSISPRQYLDPIVPSGPPGGRMGVGHTGPLKALQRGSALNTAASSPHHSLWFTAPPPGRLLSPASARPASSVNSEISVLLDFESVFSFSGRAGGKTSGWLVLYILDIVMQMVSS